MTSSQQLDQARHHTRPVISELATWVCVAKDSSRNEPPLQGVMTTELTDFDNHYKPPAGAMGKTKSGGAGKAAAKAAKKEKQAEKAAKKEQQALKASNKGKGKGAAADDDEEDLDAILERYKKEMEAVSLSSACAQLTCSSPPTRLRHWNHPRHPVLAPCSWRRPPLCRPRATTCT